MTIEKEQANKMRIGKSPLTEEYYCYQKAEDKGNGCFVIKGKKYNVTKSMLNFLDDAYEKGKSEVIEQVMEEFRKMKEFAKTKERNKYPLNAVECLANLELNIKSRLGELTTK